MRILMAALPLVFMIHDFEEIIMFRLWLDKNHAELKQRFPKFERFLSQRQVFDLSTSAFAVAVFHEFILIATITVISLINNFYHLWFGAFAVYTLHLFVHIVQWLIYRKYVPVIITSLLTLPYCVYAFFVFVGTINTTPLTMLLWMIIGIIATIISFPSAFYLADKFEKWKNKL